MALEIQLKEHTTVRKTQFGAVTTSHKQDIVIVNGREAGYVGHRPGAKFLPLAGFPKEFNKEVDEYIAKVRQTEVVKSDPAPPVIDPVTGEVR